MDKSNFIHWLFDNFQVNDNEYEIKFNQYFKGLRNGMNYDGLKNHIEATETTLPSFLAINNIQLKEKVLSSHKCEALQNIEQLRNEKKAEFSDFDEYLKNKIRSFCAKNGITPCFDRKAEL